MINNDIITIKIKIAKPVKMRDNICCNNRNTSPINLQKRNIPKTAVIEPLCTYISPKTANLSPNPMLILS